MISHQNAQRAPRHAPLTLAPTPRTHREPDTLSVAAPSDTDDRISVAALQAAADGLHALAATTRNAAEALLSGVPPRSMWTRCRVARSRAGTSAHVTTCESSPLLAEITRQVVAAHGLSQVVTVIPERSTDFVVGRDIREPVDLIVSEIVDCGLIGEGLLPTIRHARTHLLTEGGQLIRSRARLVGCLLESDEIVNLNRVTPARAGSPPRCC
jgi:hypothetical protein